MKIAHQGREKLRAQLSKRNRVYEALLLLTNNIYADNLDIVSGFEELISTADNKRRLAVWLRKVDSEIQKLRQHYGVKVSDAKLIEIVSKVEGTLRNSTFFMSKTDIKKIFDRPERLTPNFSRLPAHTLFGSDPGKHRSSKGHWELFLFEAKIFEDLAALFNIAKEQHSRSDRRSDRKPAIKMLDAVCRAVIAYSVFFVEAYLNGIALDYFLDNLNKLDEATAGLLLDWNLTSNRPRYTSLRDKAFKYPRIILGAEHSPLQEGDTSELTIILEKAARMRDLIAHPSLRPNLQRNSGTDIQVFLNLKFEGVEEIVDAAVELVRKIEAAIRGDSSRLFWLHKRGPDGTFPDSVFD